MSQKQPGRRKPLGRKGSRPADKLDSPSIKSEPEISEPAKSRDHFTQEIADRLCAEVATSRKSLRTICSVEGLPHVASIFRWFRTHPEFCEQYARAKLEQAELLVEEIIEISDDGSNDTYVDDNGNKRVDADVIQRSRLRVDSRKWLASKLLPKKYGDKVEVTGDGAKTEIMVSVTLPETRRASLIDRRRQAMEVSKN